MKKLFYLFIPLLLLIACDNKMTPKTEIKSEKPKPSFNNSIQELSKRISLPKSPASAIWIENPQPGNIDSSLIASITFSPDDYEFIVNNSEDHQIKADEIVDQDFYNLWISPHLSDKSAAVQHGEYLLLKGIQAKEPNLFTQNKHSSYIHGRVIPLGKGIVIVSLYTM